MNPIKYRDFLPEQTPRGGLFGGVDLAGFDSCVQAMNRWLEDHPVDVLRVETVTLPNIFSQQEEGPGDTELHAGAHTVWYQFVRLWYSAAQD